MPRRHVAGRNARENAGDSSKPRGRFVCHTLSASRWLSAGVILIDAEDGQRIHGRDGESK